MGFPLRQSTASQSRALGPFIDSTDFATPLTGLTIANTDIKLVVNGGASANKNSGGGTHRVNGVYGVTFDATDTATVGELEVNVNVSGALMVFDKFQVLEEAVYDALFAASAAGYLQPTTAGRTLDVDANGDVEATLSSAQRNAIADALLDRADAIETGLTPRGAWRLGAASDAGKASGGGTTTFTLRNAVADTKDRIVATVTSVGDRTAVTTDVT